MMVYVVNASVHAGKTSWGVGVDGRSSLKIPSCLWGPVRIAPGGYYRVSRRII